VVYGVYAILSRVIVQMIHVIILAVPKAKFVVMAVVLTPLVNHFVLRAKFVVVIPVSKIIATLMVAHRISIVTKVFA